VNLIPISFVMLYGCDVLSVVITILILICLTEAAVSLSIGIVGIFFFLFSV